MKMVLEIISGIRGILINVDFSILTEFVKSWEIFTRVKMNPLQRLLYDVSNNKSIVGLVLLSIMTYVYNIKKINKLIMKFIEENYEEIKEHLKELIISISRKQTVA